MEKTILQNMYNFNEPKVALVSRKDSKGCYDFVEPLIMDLYILSKD